MNPDFLNNKRKNHCSTCWLLLQYCLCGQLEKIQCEDFSINLLVHIKEWFKTSNSARLASICVNNFNLFVFGCDTLPLNWEKIAIGKRPAILFPKTNLTIDEYRPDTVIIPDGNWRQAFKMAKKLKQNHPQIPFVTFPSMNEKSQYKLRTHPDSQFISTFESIARIFGYLGHEQEQKVLEDYFQLFVSNSLKMRGKLNKKGFTTGNS